MESLLLVSTMEMFHAALFRHKRSVLSVVTMNHNACERKGLSVEEQQLGASVLFGKICLLLLFSESPHTLVENVAAYIIMLDSKQAIHSMMRHSYVYHVFAQMS